MYEKNITGMRSGRLVAIKRVGADSHHNFLWLCKCDCGGTKNVRASDIIHNSIKSCGCLRKNNLQGKRYGRLLVLEKTDMRKGRRIVWKCQCDCGNITYVPGSDLISGHTQSCGCLMVDTVTKMFTKHSMTKTRLHTVWSGMKARCNNKNHDSYHNYGGRGIRVCEEWINDFNAFYEWAIQNGYDENAKQGECTIDRIDNDGNYEPFNCRWVDMKTQAKNTRKYLKAHQ